MKRQVALTLNPDPLLFVFFAAGNGVDARHCCAGLFSSGCIFGSPGNGFYDELFWNRQESNIDFRGHNDCRSGSGNDIERIGIIGRNFHYTSAKRLMRAGLIHSTVGNFTCAHQHFGERRYTEISKSKRCRLPLISTSIISGFTSIFHPLKTDQMLVPELRCQKAPADICTLGVVSTPMTNACEIAVTAPCSDEFCNVWRNTTARLAPGKVAPMMQMSSRESQVVNVMVLAWGIGRKLTGVLFWKDWGWSSTSHGIVVIVIFLIALINNSIVV